MSRFAMRRFAMSRFAVLCFLSVAALLFCLLLSSTRAADDRASDVSPPTQVVISATVYRFSQTPGGAWKKEIASAPRISTTLGFPATMSISNLSNSKDVVGYGYSLDVMPVRARDGSITIRAEGKLLGSREGTQGTIATATGEGRVGTGPTLRLLLAPPGQGEKMLGGPAPEAASAPNPLAESGIPFVCLVEITGRLGDLSTPDSGAKAKTKTK